MSCNVLLKSSKDIITCFYCYGKYLKQCHSLPLTYCIITPVLNPNFGTISGKLCMFSERPKYKIPRAMKNMNRLPMRSIAKRTWPSSSKESTAKPHAKWMEMNPTAIPEINAMLLFLPCTTA